MNVNFLGGRPKLKPSSVQEAEYKNDFRFNLYYNALKMIALAQFKWKNLPDTVNEDYLERTLFEKGSCYFFKDEIYLCLMGVGQEAFDVYGNPSRMSVQGYDGSYYNNSLTNKNCVPIYNNQLRYPSTTMTVEYAEILSDISRSIDVNLESVKTTPLIMCDEESRLSIINAFAQRRKNVPAIFGKKDFSTNFEYDMLGMKNKEMFVSLELQQLFTLKWNEYLTLRGIPNVTVQKKERMIQDEVSRMQGGILTFAESYLKMRKLACEQINNMFGLDIDVEMIFNESEGEESGLLYNDFKNSTGSAAGSNGAGNVNANS